MGRVSDCSVVLRRFWTSQQEVLDLKLFQRRPAPLRNRTLLATLLCSVLSGEQPMARVALAATHKSWGPVQLLCCGRGAEWHVLIAVTQSIVALPPA